MKKANKKFIEINPASTDGLRWIENISTGWRFAGYTDDLIRLDHTGWFTNDFQDEVMRGVVYRLPSRKGESVFAVGYADPVNDDAARVEIITGYDIEDAARMADSIAERVAEKEREYNEAWQLGTEYNDLADTIEAERQTRRDLIAELKTLRGQVSVSTPTICNTLRGEMRKAKERILAAIKRRKEIINDNYFRGDLLSAFADGAGLSLEDAREVTK